MGPPTTRSQSTPVYSWADGPFSGIVPKASASENLANALSYLDDKASVRGRDAKSLRDATVLALEEVRNDSKADTAQLTKQINEATLTPEGPIPRIVPFTATGDDPMQFSLWLCRLEDVMRMKSTAWTSQQKAYFLIGNLDGVAREKVEELSEEERDDCGTLVAHLKRSFEGPQHRNLARQSLASCQQQVGESTSTFANRLLLLVRAATAGQDSSSQKERTLEEFVARLRPDIRYYVKLDNPSTFEQAVAKAQMVEQLLAEATADRLIRPSFPHQPIAVKAAAPLRNGEVLPEIFRELRNEQRLPLVITAEEKDTIHATALLHVILGRIQVGSSSFEHPVYFTESACIPGEVEVYNIILGDDLLRKLPPWTIDYGKPDSFVLLFTYGQRPIVVAHRSWTGSSIQVSVAMDSEMSAESSPHDPEPVDTTPVSSNISGPDHQQDETLSGADTGPTHSKTSHAADTLAPAREISSAPLSPLSGRSSSAHSSSASSVTKPMTGLTTSMEQLAVSLSATSEHQSSSKPPTKTARSSSGHRRPSSGATSSSAARGASRGVPRGTTRGLACGASTASTSRSAAAQPAADRPSQLQLRPARLRFRNSSSEGRTPSASSSALSYGSTTG
ncbi:hypothetical protein V3C99_018001 [Haemonchus contortus]|uniref:Reverse transcriptase n=1 Tax=Haemonchus contortus TaxID=6289 RepID=A0A7I5EE78_HAECO